ncbi:hypothetical protein Asppvi_002435 [Aspergillus pseudoviridinutans]|uniref:Uncharacterized protein n=1 Tax=Aspergillus pseudoviridinutans TaxID=1517512 RepID=A0A9P3B6H6_9EURO|nr:uncharacterized protein Asppvi_002435 [Aspergillus pseudoviridinutans]GIJ83610.1 hypothetical protein Asppvi_002435 [Aspergillus pseudoviridinutans]
MLPDLSFREFEFDPPDSRNPWNLLPKWPVTHRQRIAELDFLASYYDTVGQADNIKAAKDWHASFPLDDEVGYETAYFHRGKKVGSFEINSQEGPAWIENADGKIKEAWFRIIFQRDANGDLVIREGYIASNTENWRTRLMQFDHPGFYNHTGALRKRAIKQHPKQGHLCSPAWRIRTGPATEESPELSSLPQAKGEVAEGGALRLQALIHEEVMKAERNHRKTLKREEEKISALECRVKELDQVYVYVLLG